ncbi:MAG TPA: hypothetical protein PKN13_03755 [Accumulibacter sp.]|nr:hypothetical protein [Accumulibacter sp.]HMX21857.1 hypothetical protein [Accumulibacter sp.]HNC17050.1 hypothetical protein [Accumulibacter sp.]HND79726.1 hypothetical protein [Accumulibacter sp.]HNE12368.1 hypothetical protein [Accumulibacter sp.]
MTREHLMGHTVFRVDQFDVIPDGHRADKRRITMTFPRHLTKHRRAASSMVPVFRG